ncbi:MAG: hypothetical protein ACXABY_01450 [Candidatus Thorarchaeota archaeon]|jgi:hypothetical protein
MDEEWKKLNEEFCGGGFVEQEIPDHWTFRADALVSTIIRVRAIDENGEIVPLNVAYDIAVKEAPAQLESVTPGEPIVRQEVDGNPSKTFVVVMLQNEDKSITTGGRLQEVRETWAAADSKLLGVLTWDQASSYINAMEDAFFGIKP